MRILGYVAMACLFATAAWIFQSYRKDLALAQQSASTGSSIVQTRCGPIEYASVGAGPVVLVVHGTGGGFDQGLLLGRALAAHGFRAIAMSRFGYLRTPVPPDTSPAAQADAHACLLDALNIPHAAALGVSAGALSSLQFAIRHPQRCDALVLLVPLAYRPDASLSEPLSPPMRVALRALQSDFAFWALIRVAPNVVARTLLATPAEIVEHAVPGERIRVQAVRDSILPVSLRAAGLQIDSANAASIKRYDLESVDTPTLIISTKDDLFDTCKSAEYTARHIRGARFIGFESGGHMWIGHNDEILAEIASLVNSTSR